MEEITLKFSLPTGLVRNYKVKQNLTIQAFIYKNFPASRTYDNFILYNGNTRMDKKDAFFKFNLRPNQTIIVKRSIKVNYSGKKYEVIVGKYDGYLKATILNSLKHDINIPYNELIPHNFELKIGSLKISDQTLVNKDAVSVKNPYTLTYTGSTETFKNLTSTGQSVIPYDRKKNIGAPIGVATGVATETSINNKKS